MRTRAELIKLAVERLLDVFESFERKADSPAPAPPEPEPRKLRPSEQPGIDMNDLRRSIPRARPPRRPGQQSKRYNGIWTYWE